MQLLQAVPFRGLPGQVLHYPPLTVMSFNVLAEYLSDLFSFQFVVRLGDALGSHMAGRVQV